MKWIQKNYHWVIVLLAFLEMILFGGMVNSAGVFIIPITAGLEITRSSYSLAMVPYNIAATVSTMFSGLLFQKFGYKRTLIGGLLITGLSLILTAVCRTVTELCFSKILLGVGYGVCFTSGAVWIVKDWFFKHQGLVTGAVTMSSGLGGSLLTIVLTSLTEHCGWRNTHWYLAVCFFLIGLIYLLLMKNKPENVGLRPYGSGVQLKNSDKRLRSPASNWQGPTFREWLRHPLLYMMVAATLIHCSAIYLTSSVLVPYFQDQGFSPAEAAGYQSVYMLVLSVSKLLCGALADRFGAKPVGIFCIACTSLGQILLSATVNPFICYGATILCGVGLCMTSIMIPLLSLTLFGYQASSINSIVLGMASLAGGLAAPISNFVFDRTGSYIPVFVFAGLLNAALIIIYFVMFGISQKEKKKKP